MTKENEDISRLPKWVQHKMRVYEMRLAEAAQTINELHGKEPTNVFVNSGLDDDKPLPMNARIEFRLDGERYIACRIDKNNKLYIYGISGLKICPESSNSIRVSLKD
jgi:hypothetical protein